MDIQVIASGSGGNCYTVTDGETKLMIECGIPWKKIQQKLNFKTSEIAGCFISHSHGDHCKAAKDLIKAGIDLYLSPATALNLGLSGHRINGIEAEVRSQIGTWAIKPFETEHDCEGSLGFVMASKTGEKLVYITDSFYSRYRFIGITHYMVEINYDLQTLNENVIRGIIPVEHKNRIIQSHFSLENAVKFFKATDLSKVREIWILHLSNDNANENRIKTTLQKVTGKLVYIAPEG